MNISVKATNIVLTPAISQYIDEKVGSLEKFIVATDPTTVRANIEVGKTTRHHHSGNDIFLAEINLHIDGKVLRAVSEQSTLYAALDDMKDEIAREINSSKNKQRTLLRRGGATVKNLIKGLGGFYKRKR
ncbi:MAG: ribosome-associated translation inhibitor RaiA [bacterium]|nr:ribosome-associated translation inhibitor RaiA [bacterium]